MARPCNKESIMSVADTIVWAFLTYGFPNGAMAGTRHCNRENIKSVNDTIVWAWAS